MASATVNNTDIRMINTSDNQIEILISAGQPVRVADDFFSGSRYVLVVRPFSGSTGFGSDPECQLHGVTPEFLRRAKLVHVDCHAESTGTRYEFLFDEPVAHAAKVHSFDFRSFNLTVRLLTPRIAIPKKAIMENKNLFTIILRSYLSKPESIAIDIPSVLKTLEVFFAEPAETENGTFELRVGRFTSQSRALKIEKLLETQYPEARLIKINKNNFGGLIENSGIKIIRNLHSENSFPDAENFDENKPAIRRSDSSNTKIDALQRARQLLVKRHYNDAIPYLQALSEVDDPIIAREALELLGVTREKNNQPAHAKAEYERYLARYPQDSADYRRVKQRLIGLLTATTPLPKQLKIAKSDSGIWRNFGSLSQSYRRNKIKSDLIDNGDEPSSEEVTTRVYYNGRNKSSVSNSRAVVSLSHTHDFINSNNEEHRISKLYYKRFDKLTGNEFQVGRMRNDSTGYTGRFDGISWHLADPNWWHPGFVAGTPVAQSRDDIFGSEKTFIGASLDFESAIENLELRSFFIHQVIGSVTDRQYLGLSSRYFHNGVNTYSYMTYDTLFNELDTFYATGTVQLSADDAFFLSIDHRNSPGLSLSNALINTGEESLDSLGLESSTLKTQAKLNTSKTSLLTIGGSHKLDSYREISSDITVSHIDISGQPSGNEYYVNGRYIERDFFTEDDIWIYTAQLSETPSSESTALSVNPRFRFDGWQLAPRLYISNRSSDTSKRLTYRPSLRAQYNWSKAVSFDAELSISVFKEEQLSGKDTITDTYFTMGYYYVF